MAIPIIIRLKNMNSQNKKGNVNNKKNFSLAEVFT